ncbi:kinetochore protein Nuf2 isoform X1 [Halyomorpha halys]|uniref:kinetochore protein Nuf2 isoform X1 n=2 Tax=Halyomorpha halys TaxID=286706 RepID=UPI0006D4FBB5|nr:myosin-6-like isoform X1 [Halyomorpha halys]
MEKLVDVIHAFFPDFNMSINDLKNPTVTFVRDFYSRVLIELGVDSENLRKPQLDQLEYAEGIELLHVLNLITAINTAFPFININLFDMLQPTPKRNAMLMSKVMNFMDFCERRVAANNDEIRKFQEAKDIENHLMETIDMKAKELNDLACELESCQSGRQELKIEIESLENGCYENRKYNANLKENIQRLEENLSIVNKEAETLKLEISSVTREMDALKSQIVVNPMEEKRELDVKLKHKDGVLEKKKQLEDKLKEYKEVKEKMQLQLDMMERRVVPIIKELEVLRLSQEMAVSAQKAKKELEELQKAKERCVEELDEIRKNCAIEESNLKSQISIIDKEEELHRNTLDEKKSEYTQKSKNLKKQQKMLKEELSSVNREISNLENDYHELRSKFSIAVQALHSKLNEITQGKQHIFDY